MSALEDAVQGVRLSDAQSQARHRFTAATDRGVLALRRASGPWSWTRWLLRAGCLLGDGVVASAMGETEGEQRVAQLRVVVAEGEVESLEIEDLLTAAVHRPTAQSPVAARVRHRLATAVNQALAAEPPWLELLTPAGSLRWERRAAAPPEADAYRVRALASLQDPQSILLRVGLPEGSFTDRLRRWAGAGTLRSTVAAVWSESLGRPVDAQAVQDGLLVGRTPSGPSVELGTFGRWWPGRADAPLRLFREGVVLTELADAFASVGVPHEGLHGTVVCEAIRLDADERAVVVDRELHRLVAWLESARGLATHATDASDARTWKWAEQEPIIDAHGIDIAEALVERQSEVTFAWVHQIAGLRALGIHALALTPRGAERLFEAGVSLFPAEVLLRASGGREQDLTALRQGTLAPVSLGFEAPLEAYVHRHAVATQGFIRVRAWNREISQAPCTLEGVTAVVSLEVQAMPTEVELERLHAAVDSAVQAQRWRLLELVGSTVDTEAEQRAVPLVSSWLRSATGRDAGLGYRPSADGVALQWDAAGPWSLRVGRERDGTARTLGDALHRYRDAGGIVVGEPTSRWQTLESNVAVWTTWMLTDLGREILTRLLGQAAVWTMPTVPEAQLRPAPLRTQGLLRLGAARVAELRELAGRRSDAACALRGHLMVALACGEDTWGLEAVPLLSYYDPEALQPRRSISLQELEQLGPVRVVPPTVADRTLSAGVLEADPGLAYALAELQLVSAGELRRTDPKRRGKRRPRDARKSASQTWLRQPVTHRLFAGGLALSSAGGGIEVWARGLRVGRFDLPPPWHVVGGKLWLSAEAPTRGHAAIESAVLRTMGAFREAARDAARLSPPGSERRQALATFVERTQSRQRPTPAKEPVAASLGSDRLAALLRFGLGRVVAVETASLSWKIVRTSGEGDGQVLKLGGRHAVIRAARADDATSRELVVAALLVLSALCGLDGPPFDLSMAITRVLAVLD